MVNGCVYYRGKVSRAVVEAGLNGMTYGQYIHLLNNGTVTQIDRLQSLAPEIHVHHRDRNGLNNKPENLEPIHFSFHNHEHAIENLDKLSFIAVPDRIVSIEAVGKRECYDLVCQYPYNNYVANGFVVHNSGGKSTLAINTMVMAQHLCWRCFKITPLCECSADPLLMRSLWLDVEGCIASGQEMFNPVSGFLGSIEDWMSEQDERVVSCVDKYRLDLTRPLQRVDSGEMETLEVRTQTTTIRGTYDHPVLVFRDREAVWVHLGEVKVGDSVARPWRVSSVGVPGLMTPDDAELLGLLLGDGAVTSANFTFTNKDPEVWRRLERLLLQRGYFANRFDDRHARLVMLGKKGRKFAKGELSPLKQWLSEIGVYGRTAGSKRIPGSLMEAELPVVTALLRGLWMTDGGVNPARATASFCSSSKVLAYQVRWLLARIGILGRVHPYPARSVGQNGWWAVTVDGKINLQSFQGQVKLYSYKGEAAEFRSQRTRGQVHYPAEMLLPGYCNRLHHERSRWLNDSGLWWDRVTQVMHDGEVRRCFDATVPIGNSWVVQDVVVHNTYDRDWAGKIGADPDRYLLALAEDGEQYIDIAQTALKAEDCGLVVFDSLAALSPAAEMEAAASDKFMAIQAQMIGRAVRNIKQQLIRERKKGHPCCVLFVNQLRVKIGQMFGDPETMSGGYGMKHEFSLLLRCAKRTLKKDGPDKKYIDDHRKKNMADRFAFSIRKAKIQTIAGLGEYVRVSEDIPELGLTKGQVDDFSTLMTYAKTYGIVRKEGNEWRYFGYKAKNLDGIKEVWQKNLSEKMKTQREIIDRAKERLAGSPEVEEPGTPEEE